MPRPQAFFPHLAIFLLSLLLIPGCSPSGSSSSPSSSSSARSLRPTETLATGWRFLRADSPGAQAPSFDDSAWAPVAVPHTWLAADNGSYYRGPAWYRRTVMMPPTMPGSAPPPTTDLNKDQTPQRRSILRFGAASLVADIYVNGRQVGTHRGGYAAFAFDITPELRPGENTLAVRVNNATDNDVTPLSGDFTIFGGLYRPVELITLPAISISPLDHASPGVYLTPSLNLDGTANLKVVAKLRNVSGKPAAVTMTTTLRDAAGRPVASLSSAQPLIPTPDGQAGTDSEHTFKLSAPHLWAGRADPYLYSVTVELSQNGQRLDAITQPVGFRSFRVDADKGFFLNGKPYPLHGVNTHQGRPSVGYADTPAQREEDYALIHELGANSVRLAHYQHGDDEYGLCDRLGLVAWAELALVNKMTDTPAFKQNADEQLRELIKQSYNHPSIVFWSMYNEPWVDARSGTQEQWRLIDDLVHTAHTLDPSRLTTGAIAGTEGPINWYMDVSAINRYFGWYGGKPSDWSAELAKARAKYAGKAIGIGEYGAGASAHQHEMNPLPVRPGSNWHPEEWQANVHEHAWPALRDADWLWCRFIWVMFDFHSAGRNEGDTRGINDKGLVTADRKLRKDAFYYYKANWSDEPVLHLASKRFTPRLAGPTEIKIYSNCDDIRLTVNDRETALTSADGKVHTALATLSPGATILKATATRAGRSVEDRVTWTITPGAATRQFDQAATRPAQ